MARGNDLQVVTQVDPDQAGLVTLTMRNLSLGPPVHLRREGVRDTARKRVIDTVSDAQPPDELNLPRRAVQERPGQEEEQQIMLRGLRLEKRGEKRDKRERGLLVVVKPKLHRHVRSRLRLSCKEKDPPIVQGLAHRKLRLLCPGKLANVSEVAWRRTARVLTRVIVSPDSISERCRHGSKNKASSSARTQTQGHMPKALLGLHVRILQRLAFRACVRSAVERSKT